MNATINGRTLEEIKLGLVHCLTAREYRNCLVCPYGTPRKRGMLPCDCEVRQDILALIDQLLEDKKQLERERDAAVEDINEAAMTGCLCYVCSRNEKGHCKAFDHGIFEATVMCGQYEWRGVQEVE